VKEEKGVSGVCRAGSASSGANAQPGARSYEKKGESEGPGGRNDGTTKRRYLGRGGGS